MAIKGVHVNVYKLPGTNTWRCDLKLNSTESGEGVTLRGVADEDDEDIDENEEQLRRAVRKAKRKRRKLARAMRGYEDDDDREEDEDDAAEEATDAEPVKAKKRRRSLWRAISKSVALAKHVLENPGVKAALPGAASAVKALELVNKAQKTGLTKKLKRRFEHPLLKKLARELEEAATGTRTAMSGGGCCLCDERATQQPRKRAQQLGRAFDFMSGQSGNPHPFAALVAQQMDDELNVDPLVIKRLASMQAQQRRAARLQRG
jgi:hypothetical protein